MDANIGLGIASGAKQAFDENRDRPFREARLAEAKLRADKSRMELQEFTRQAPLRQEQENTELLRLQDEARRLQQDSLFRDTIDAFRTYDADKNAKHLNQFISRAKRNPIGQRFYGEFARVDDLQNTPEHQMLLKQAGYPNPAYVFQAESGDKPNLVVATTTDGTQYIVDMDKLYAATGYLDYMQDQELTSMTRRAQIDRLLRQGVGPQTELERAAQAVRDEQPGLSEEEVFTLARRRLGRGSELERTAAGVQLGTAMPTEESFDTAKKLTESRPTSTKETEAIADLRDKYTSIVGADPTALRDPAVRAQAGRVITDLERVTGSKLSTEDKRVARDIRELLSLGKTVADELTADEAGLVDRALLAFKKYFSNETEGLDATSAYEAFRNVYRNALYGATVTGGEARAFEAAIGSLSQQEGPVLQQFKTQLQQLRTNLESIIQLNDPDIASYYLGTDLDNADNIVRAFDERIDMVNRALGKRNKDKVTVAPEKRSLDNIFAGAK